MCAGVDGLTAQPADAMDAVGDGLRTLETLDAEGEQAHTSQIRVTAVPIRTAILASRLSIWMRSGLTVQPELENSQLSHRRPGCVPEEDSVAL